VLNVVVIILPEVGAVQRPAASFSDVLTCVDLSVYLMMEGSAELL